LNWKNTSENHLLWTHFECFVWFVCVLGGWGG
jgi:hypothetical protein